MSEEEKAPKKAARKRVVKKGVRGSRAPKKKVVSKSEADLPVGEESAILEETATAPEQNVETVVAEPSPEGETGSSPIEVVEEEASGEDKQKKKEKAPEKTKPAPEDSGEDDEEKGQGRNRRGRNRRGGRDRERDEPAPKRTPIDRAEAAEKAWQIYQAELEEEGVSLVDPRRGREVAKRCLELATVFCEERDRYLQR